MILTKNRMINSFDYFIPCWCMSVGIIIINAFFIYAPVSKDDMHHLSVHLKMIIYELVACDLRKE
ncbi:hypothetical protein HZS_2547 [Henneguya salminicola]|nr:hypothetical protein HZS_2547 [Henneguya salminicola]